MKFSKIDYFNAYNLALGTINENGEADYCEVTNNGDLIRLFSTIVKCIEMFFEKSIGENIYFSGDTEQKTKVYQEILRRHYPVFSRKFHIFGISEKEYDVILEQFDHNHEYSGFIIKQNML